MTKDNRIDNPSREEKGNSSNFVRLSVNLSHETADTFKTLAERKGLSFTEAIRRAITIWKFVEDQLSQGHELAIVESDGNPRKVLIL
ncbi:ribbon-helix-helix protein, CopG family [Nonomuraea candida]|uniref:ribbon-helix-helix protein, CopG family n=1 Tax=Nonomuraea candida TaxID=359159 RepID=UPI0012FA5F0B|nr:ribbon-helix-helix protein, CopG family [Nonomuraea candida]